MQKTDDKALSLEIDGRPVSFQRGATILKAAQGAGIRIPSLCSIRGLSPYGSCRICSVEIEGRRGYYAACTTPAEEGMRVRASSEKLASMRRTIIELYLSDHPEDCDICNSKGACALRQAAMDAGVTGSRFRGKDHLGAPKDESDPYFTYDPSRCIVCEGCTRACNELQGTFALTLVKRGFEAVMKPGPADYFNSECVACGACVAACPTGALTEKSLLEKGKADRVTVTTCGYCGIGCTFKVETRKGEIVRMVPDEKGGANLGHACVKGRFAWTFAGHPDRIRAPLFRKDRNEPWKEISWEEAIGYAASEFKRILASYGGKSVATISSARFTNEENYLVQKLVKAGMGNNNVDNCARICHMPTGYGLGISFGTGAGTQDFTSVLASDVIMVAGSNPTESHPVMGALIRRRARGGAKLIIIDPRVTEVAKSPHVNAECHLRPTPGTNVALMNAIAHCIMKEGLHDQGFIAERCKTETFEMWRDFILQPENSPESAQGITGVAAEEIKRAARLYAQARRASIFYGLGVTEHSQGSTCVSAIANLAMITGNIGRPGTGISPLRGQNNVQGAVDMGTCPEMYTGYQYHIDMSARMVFEKAWNAKLDPNPGLRIPDMFRAALDGKVKAMFVLGEDVVQTNPDSNEVIEALKSMEFVVIQDIFLNETSRYAHMVLPGSSFLEKDGTFTNWERRIQRVRQVLPPLTGKQDWEVIRDLSAAMGYPMDYRHPSEVMDEIARLAPSFSGVTYEKLEEPGGIQWPCNEKAPIGTPILHAEIFAGGKGKFYITKYVPSAEKTTPEFPLILTTVRNLYQYNSGTLTRRTPNVAWYMDDILEMNPLDAERYSVKDGGLVEIRSSKGRITQVLRTTERVPEGLVCTTFHSPKYMTNIVTTGAMDWAVGTFEYKVTAVSVKKAAEPSSSTEVSPSSPEDAVVKMANEVGDFFEPYPEELALEGITNHLKKFWDPGLVNALEKIVKDGGAGLSDIIIKAFNKD